MRLRRLRRTPLLRDMVRETRLGADDLIYPVFVEVKTLLDIDDDLTHGLTRTLQNLCSLGLR
ncbi:hypothetical protein ABE525_07140 [Pseudomonas wadenswilerensis]|uniref:hypothetical protein n=1 Tax=Pseudomonas wadenswilerensis TaxID=1785161 RepID=UPI0032082B4C